MCLNLAKFSTCITGTRLLLLGIGNKSLFLQAESNANLNKSCSKPYVTPAHTITVVTISFS